MRLFVAINLPIEERERLSRAVRELQERAYPIRWVKAANVHLTLKFLGEVAEERLAVVSRAIDSATGDLAPFQLDVRDFGAFPSARRPRVVWAGIESCEALEALQGRLESDMESVGFEREQRPFHPHLTLGRPRKSASAGDFRGFDEAISRLTFHARLPVEAVDLMGSVLRPTGAVYTIIHSAALGRAS